MRSLKRIFVLVSIIFIAISCSSSSDGDDGQDVNFDRSAMLTNMADNIFLPALEDFQSKVSALDVARANFVNDINQNNLDALSDAWLIAYKSWQNLGMLNIGIAETLTDNIDNGFRVFFNVYPVTASLIEDSVSDMIYDLNTEPYYSAQGFPALDFLIHGTASGDISALDKFTNNTNANGFITYLTDVQSQMNSRTSTIFSDWQNNYRDVFTSNLSSSATGSLSVFVNSYIQYYEFALRRNKIGNPAGNFSNMPLPNTVEAFYKQDISKELALEALNAVVKVFNGQAITGNSSGGSLASYLDALDRTDLKDEINNQFEEAKTKIEALDDNFVNQINTDNSKMTEAYDALQRAVVLLKVDMASALDIAIVFQDNDTD